MNLLRLSVELGDGCAKPAADQQRQQVRTFCLHDVRIRQDISIKDVMEISIWGPLLRRKEMGVKIHVSWNNFLTWLQIGCQQADSQSEATVENLC